MALFIICVLWCLMGTTMVFPQLPKICSLEHTSDKIVAFILLFVGAPFMFVTNCITEALGVLFPEGWDDDDDDFRIT